jgi:hypothetical protein
MKYEPTVQDKLSIPEDFKVERQGSEISKEFDFISLIRIAFKPGKSLVKTLFQVMFCGIGFNFSQFAIGVIVYHFLVFMD